MNGEYTGRSESGMILNMTEFLSMMEAYKDLNPIERAVIDEKLQSGGIDGLALVRGALAGQVSTATYSPDASPYGFVRCLYLPKAACSGVILEPYTGSRPTVRYPDGAVAFLSDKPLNSARTLSTLPYNSYLGFLEEFQRKLGAYLPQDFDWHAHLGKISYAMRAVDGDRP